MRTRVSFLLLALLSVRGGFLAAHADDEPTGADPVSETQVRALLKTLVDLPTRALRATLAKSLAARRDIPLALWLRVMRGFGRFEKPAPGASSKRIETPVGDGTVAQIFTAYVPPKHDGLVPAPLLMVYHGSGGDGREDWRAWQAVADALQMIVVCPGDQAAMGGYTADAKERDTAWAAVRHARRVFNIDENRIYATGVSRGGHLVWDMALRQPDRFAAIAPMIGAPRLSPAKGQNTLRYLENLARVPIRDLQGSKDDARMLQNLRYAFRKLKGYKAVDAALIEFPELGHSFEYGAVPWIDWFKACLRTPVPKTVVRRYAKPGEGRAFHTVVLKASAKVQEIPQLSATRAWARWSEQKQRVYVADFLEARTGRLEVTHLEPGVFRVRAKDVKQIRLLLTREMIDADGRVTVNWNGRRIRKTVKLDKRVLLTEFAERFDRTFLPIAAIKVP